MSDTPRFYVRMQDLHPVKATQDMIPMVSHTDYERELSAAREDAERYRYLRDNATGGEWEFFNDNRLIGPTMLDTNIDAARKDSQ